MLQRLVTRMAKGIHHFRYNSTSATSELMLTRKTKTVDESKYHLRNFHGRYELPRDSFVTRPSCSHRRGHDPKLNQLSLHVARRRAVFLFGHGTNNQLLSLFAFFGDFRKPTKRRLGDHPWYALLSLTYTLFCRVQCYLYIYNS